MGDIAYIKEMIIMEKGKPTKLVPILVSKDDDFTIARVTLTANQAINHNTATLVTGFTESYDTSTNFSGNSYDARIAGYYKADWAILFNDPESKLILAASQLFKNGALFSSGSYWTGLNQANAGSSGSDIVQLAVGDNLKLYGLMQTSDASAAVMLAGVYTHLSVHLIGT